MQQHVLLCLSSEAKYYKSPIYIKRILDDSAEASTYPSGENARHIT
jgi:hypothetical protein